MEAIEVERDIAITAGKLRRKYYAAYNTELPDAIIAATAKERGLKLATANEKRFRGRIPLTILLQKRLRVKAKYCTRRRNYVRSSHTS
ncbi:PIN domain-containing protein [Dehalococcoidia bacterium]|nr:PIN domain-containing protein [Dehalococcoidia bacterium]